MASTWSTFMGAGTFAIGAVFAAFGAYTWIAWGDASFGVWLVVLGVLFAATPVRYLFTARRDS